MIIYLDLCFRNYYSFALLNYKMVTVVGNIKIPVKFTITHDLNLHEDAGITKYYLNDINWNEVFTC